MELPTTRQEVEFDMAGERRTGLPKKCNHKTMWVRPFSRHPSCVHLNANQTRDIKRHVYKHNVEFT